MRLFPAHHRRDKLSEAGFARKLEAARAEVFRVATTRVPQGKHARNLAKRFHQHGDAYFRFITTPGIEPTNNLAEQAIRFVVIDRRITQGTRSETGRRWCERIWTTIATCAQQGCSVFEFLLASVESHLRGAPPPSLMPSGPYRHENCDGLLLSAVTCHGVRMPISEIVETISQIRRPGFVVIDAAQAVNHVPLHDTAKHADFLIAGTHKWIRAYHPMGLGFCCRPRAERLIGETFHEMLQRGELDDPLLQFTSATNHN